MEAFRDDADDHMSITSKILAHSSLATQVAVAAALEAIQGNEDASSSSLRGRRRRARRNNDGKNETDQNMRVMRRKLTTEQLNYLEMSFGTERKLESQRKNKLASELGLDPRQVAVWFQNRRARWKSKRLEEEYSKLKAAHEGVRTEKYQLEAEVLKLQEQLAQVEKERLKLEERVERMSSSSPKEVGWSTLLGELAPLGRHENIFDLSEVNYIHEIEWGNLCKYGL